MIRANPYLGLLLEMILIFICGLFQEVQAQNKTTFGFMIAPEMTIVPHNQNENLTTKPRSGISLEAFAKTTIKRRCSANLGIGYCIRGRYAQSYQAYYHSSPQVPYPGLGTDLVKDQVWLMDIHAPILIKFHISSQENGFFFGFGINPALMIYQHQSYIIESPNNVRRTWHRKGSGTKANMAIQGCLGYNYLLGNAKALQFDLFANHSKLRFWDNHNPMLSFGLRFGIWI